MVLAVYRFVVTVLEDCNVAIRFRSLQTRLAADLVATSVRLIDFRMLFLQDGAIALLAMVTAAQLGLIGAVFDMFIQRVVRRLFGLGFSLAQMYALLFRMRLLSAVTFDMGRPLLSFGTTVLALGDWSALLRYKGEFSVYDVVSEAAMRRRTTIRLFQLTDQCGCTRSHGDLSGMTGKPIWCHPL